MRQRPGLTVPLLLLAAFSTPGPWARAQQGVDATAHFRTQLGAERISSLALSPVEPRYQWLVGLLYGYGRSPVRGEHAGLLGTRNVVSDQHLLEVRALVGLPFVELGFAFPVILAQQGERWTDSEGEPRPAVRSYAAGDLRLHAKGVLVEPRRYGVGLALAATLTTPTGQVDRFAGSPGVVLDSRLVVDLWISRTATFAVNVGYVFRSSEERFEALGIDDALHLGAGFLFSFNDLGLPLHLWGEVVAASQIQDLFGTVKATPVEGRFGVRFWNVERFFVDVGWGVAIVRGAGLPRYRVLVDLGFTFETPGVGKAGVRTVDRDGDGIPDAQDRCPDQAEDFDGFEDADGCPEVPGPTVPEVEREKYERKTSTPWWQRWRWKQAKDQARAAKPARPAPPRRPGDVDPAPPGRPTPPRTRETPTPKGPDRDRARLPDLQTEQRTIKESSRRLGKTFDRIKARVKHTEQIFRDASRDIKRAVPRRAPPRDEPRRAEPRRAPPRDEPRRP